MTNSTGKCACDISAVSLWTGTNVRIPPGGVALWISSAWKRAHRLEELPNVPVTVASTFSGPNERRCWLMVTIRDRYDKLARSHVTVADQIFNSVVCVSWMVLGRLKALSWRVGGLFRCRFKGRQRSYNRMLWEDVVLSIWWPPRLNNRQWN